MTLTSAERTRLRKQAHDLSVIAHIGKAGMTEGVLDEMRRQLKEKKLIKVRLLESASGGDDKQTADALATALGAELVEVRGHTAVLFRPRA